MGAIVVAVVVTGVVRLGAAEENGAVCLALLKSNGGGSGDGGKTGKDKGGELHFD